MSVVLPVLWRMAPLNAIAEIVRGVSFDRSEVMVCQSIVPTQFEPFPEVFKISEMLEFIRVGVNGLF